MSGSNNLFLFLEIQLYFGPKHYFFLSTFERNKHFERNSLKSKPSLHQIVKQSELYFEHPKLIRAKI